MPSTLSRQGGAWGGDSWGWGGDEVGGGVCVEGAIQGTQG